MAFRGENHAYFSLPSPQTTYAPQGIELIARNVLPRQQLAAKQQQEVERLEAAGVRHYDLNPYLAMVNLTFMNPRGESKAYALFDATFGNYVESRAVVRPGETNLPPQVQTVGTGVILMTSDKKLIYSERAPENGNYPNYRDGSANGSLEVSNLAPGQAITDLAKENVIHEVIEEIRIPEEELVRSLAAKRTRLMPLGLVQDERLKHLNIAFGGITEFTSEQITSWQGDVSGHNKQLDANFSDPVHTIDATPAAIRDFLLDTDHPLTPAAIGMYLRAGSRMIFEQQTQRGRSENIAIMRAEIWRRITEARVKHAYHILDRKVQRYYRAHPEEQNKTRERKPLRRWIEGVDPAFRPDEQGVLPKPLRRSRQSITEAAA